MTLKLTIFGYEVARMELEVEQDSTEPTPIDKGIKKVSRWWVSRGMR